MKFTKEIIRKARAIFKEITPSNCDNKREYLSKAYSATFKYFKALEAGILRFKKLAGELCLRKVCSLEAINYEKKTTFEKHSMFSFYDLEKRGIIRVNYFQLI